MRVGSIASWLDVIGVNVFCYLSVAVKQFI